MNRRKFLLLLALSPAVKLADPPSDKWEKLTAADVKFGFFEDDGVARVTFVKGEVIEIRWDGVIGFGETVGG